METLEKERSGKTCQGGAILLSPTCNERKVCAEHGITWRKEPFGGEAKEGWQMDNVEPALLDSIGNELFLWVE